jgi:HAMP domain-containing protein
MSNYMKKLEVKEMAKKKVRGEVSALRGEVINLAGQLNKAVERIQELESHKKKKASTKPTGRVLTMQEEVQALREEVKNLASALGTAVERVRELEEK